MRPISLATQALLLLEVKPRTRDEIATALGIDTRQVKETTSSLRRRGVATSTAKRPVIYSITQKGLYWLDPATDPGVAEKKERVRLARQKRQSAYRKAKRAIARAAIESSPEDDFPIERRFIPAPPFADEFVFAAIQSRPAFQAAWC